MIPLWLSDMDFRSPPAVIEALKRRCDHGVFGYTHPPIELVDTVLARLCTAYGWTADRDWIVWLPGLVTGLNVSCRAVGEDGDEVLSAVPVYPPFLSAPRNSRRTLRTVELVLRDGRWTFDFDALAKAISPRTRLFLLCSPHNPVGRLFTRDELTTLARICERHDVVICSDEIHCDLILDEEKKQIPAATLSHEVADRTITLMAPSKTFNVPGLGCSFAVIPNRALRERFRAAMAGIVPDVNAMGFTAALAAYGESGEWLQAVLAYLRKNRDTVACAVAAMPGLSMTHVEATYLAWIDTRDAGINDPATFFLNEGVGLSDGKEFGGPGFVRLNFACPRSILTAALDRMRRAIERTRCRGGCHLFPSLVR